MSASTSENLIYPDAPSKEHSNLSSFLAYAERSGLNPESTVYRGTHYEYTVAQALSQYGFFLKRVGGASDFGKDLLGTWTIPSTRHTLRVLVQCKAGARVSGPQYVREMQGALGEAPPGWRGSGVMGLLVAEKPATKGVREALRKVPRPMSYVFCTRNGLVQQILWNVAAEEEGLEGVSVGVRHGETTTNKHLVLTRGGRALPLLEKVVD